MAFFSWWDVASLSSQGTVSSAIIIVSCSWIAGPYLVGGRSLPRPAGRQASSSGPLSTPSRRLVARKRLGSWPPCRSYEPCLLPSQRLWLWADGPTCYWLWLAAVQPIWRFPWGPCRASICTALLPMPLDNQSECGSVYRRLLHIGCMIDLSLRPRSLCFLLLAAGQSPSAGESSAYLGRSATVPSTTAVAPVPGPTAS